MSVVADEGLLKHLYTERMERRNVAADPTAADDDSPAEAEADDEPEQKEKDSPTVVEPLKKEFDSSWDVGGPRIQTGPPPATVATEECKWMPAVVLDGTKAILRIRSNQPFQVDHCLRVIFSSNKLRRLERSVAFSTFMSDAAETTVVVDSGSPSHRFIPVLLAENGGTVYTREGVGHILLGGSGEVTRSKVSAPLLPSKACNKFVALNVWAELRAADKQLSSRNQAVFPWNPSVSHTRSNATGGLLLVRVDESVFRYKIGRGVVAAAAAGPSSSPREDELPSESVEFADGRALMWTAGVSFLFIHSMYCYKRVLGATGNGVLWVDNPRQAHAGPHASQNNLVN